MNFDFVNLSSEQRHFNLMRKVSYEFDNFLSRIEKIKCSPIDDENIFGIEFEEEEMEPLAVEAHFEFIKPSINNVTVNLDDEPMEVCDGTISLPASTEDLADKLNHKENMIFQKGMIELDPVNSFNSTAVPKTFDHFLNDIKQSSAASSNFGSRALTDARLDFNYLHSSMKIMTSSVDKDLNKDANFHFRKLTKINQINQASMSSLTSLASLPASASNFHLNDLKTSSPFKPTQKINRSYTVDQMANLNKMNNVNSRNQNNNFDSNESLNDMSSKSSSTPDEFVNRYPQFEYDEQFEEPRVVFNTTYTSWSTNEDQQIEKPNIMNKTQDLNNNEAEKKAELNRTVDIVTSEEEPKKDVLNVTQEIIVDNSKSRNFKKPEIAISKPSQIASNPTKRTSVIIPSKAAQQFTRPVVKNNEALKSNSPPKQQQQIMTTSNAEFKHPEVPLLKSASPTKSSEKPKSFIPRMNFGKPAQGSQIPTASSVVSSLPTKAVQKASPPNPTTSARLGSGNSTSSSSLKENKKSPMNQKSMSPATKTAGFTNMTNNIAHGYTALAPPKTKINAPTQPHLVSSCSNVSNKPSTAAISSVNPSSKINSGVEQKIISSKIPSSSQIPSLKPVSSAIPTFRNATNNPSLRK